MYNGGIMKGMVVCGVLLLVLAVEANQIENGDVRIEN